MMTYFSSLRENRTRFILHGIDIHFGENGDIVVDGDDDGDDDAHQFRPSRTVGACGG